MKLKNVIESLLSYCKVSCEAFGIIVKTDYKNVPEIIIADEQRVK